MILYLVRHPGIAIDPRRSKVSAGTRKGFDSQGRAEIALGRARICGLWESNPMR